MAVVISVALAQQLQVPYLIMRDLYEVRERPSRMYSWTALVTSQLLAEAPWNIFACSIFYLCWYWTVAYSSEATRAGYTYLMLAIIFPLYYTTIGTVCGNVCRSIMLANVVSLLFDIGCCVHVSKYPDRRFVVQCFLRLCAHIVRPAHLSEFRLPTELINLAATVCYSHTAPLDGGSGCTVSRLSVI